MTTWTGKHAEQLEALERMVKTRLGPDARVGHDSFRDSPGVTFVVVAVPDGEDVHTEEITMRYPGDWADRNMIDDACASIRRRIERNNRTDMPSYFPKSQALCCVERVGLVLQPHWGSIEHRLRQVWEFSPTELRHGLTVQYVDNGIRGRGPEAAPKVCISYREGVNETEIYTRIQTHAADYWTNNRTWITLYKALNNQLNRGKNK